MSKMSPKQIFHSLENFVKTLGKETDILAIKMIVNRKLHYIERIIWLLVILGCTKWTMYLSDVQFNRFNKSPVVVTVDRDNCNWINVMPAITVCYNPEINETALDDILMEEFNITANHSDFFLYISFFSTLINVRLKNLQYLSKFEEFENVDLFKIFKKLSTSHHHSVFSSNLQHKISNFELISELGFCNTFNSQISLRIKEQGLDYVGTSLNCSLCRQECFIQIGIFDGFGSITVHSPYDLPEYYAKTIKFKPYEDIRATYKSLETDYSASVLSLTKAQRKCEFYEVKQEALESRGYKIYTQNLCLIHCRAKLALNLCQCLPFFYINMKGPICRPKDYNCLVQNKWPIWSVSTCNCPQTCTEMQLTPQTIKRTIKVGIGDPAVPVTSFRLDLLPPKVRKRRHVVFGFTDLLVSFGGVWSLVLGISIMTVLNIVYVVCFFSCEFIYNYCNCRQIYVSLFLRQLKSN